MILLIDASIVHYICKIDVDISQCFLQHCTNMREIISTTSCLRLGPKEKEEYAMVAVSSGPGID